MPRAYIKKNVNIIDVPPDFVTLTAITKDGYFVYKVKYLVDPVKAVRNKTFLVNIHVAERPFVRPAVKTFPNFNTSTIIRNLRMRWALQKDILRSKKENFIFTTISDLTKKIPNDQTVNLSNARFTDAPFVNTIRSIKPALVSDLRNRNLQLPIFDINVNRLEESDIAFSTRDIKSAAFNLILNSKQDPAQLAGSRTHSILSAGRGISGNIANRPSRTQDTLQSSRILIGSILNKRNLSNNLQLQETDFVNTLTSERSHFIEVEETIRIPVDNLEQDEFYFIFQLKNNCNVTQQTITGIVPHSRNVALLEIPVDPPQISTIGVSRLGLNILDIKQIDKNANSVKIYRRHLNKVQPILDATYDFIGEERLEAEDGIKRFEDIYATTNPVIYRVIPVNSSGIIGAEFGSVVMQQKRGIAAKRSNRFLRPNFVSISHELTENSIILTLKHFPSEPIALRLLRKDLSFPGQKDTQIKDIIKLNADSNIPIFFEDTSVKEGRIYQYTIEYFYKDGNKEFAANKLVIEYCPVLSNIAQLEVSAPEVINQDDEPDVVFSIEKNLIATQGDLIRFFLREQGLSGEYQDQIVTNREFLQSLFAVQVTRTNISTGELEDFGIINSPRFSDKKFGIKSSVKPLEPGYSYRYNLTAYARDPKTLFPTLEVTKTSGPNTEYSFNPFETQHPVTLQQGNIVTPASLQRNHSKTTFTFGLVVDTKFVDVTLADVLPSLYEGKASKFGENSISVQWKIQGNVNKIDHFIVVLESLGMRTIVGKSHNITNTNTFQFVDKLSNQECGELYYFIIPVYYDYSRGPELKTNQVII